MMLRRKKKVEKKRKEKKAATVQKLNPNWPIATVQNLKKKKRFNKSNVYCSGSVFPIVSYKRQSPSQLWN